jgi:hypothetical protein
MHKKTISKMVAILALIGFMGLLAPGLSSAEKKASRFDYRSIIRKPAVWISSVWSWIAPVFDFGDTAVAKSPLPSNSTFKARPTGDLPSPRPSKSD